MPSLNPFLLSFSFLSKNVGCQLILFLLLSLNCASTSAKQKDPATNNKQNNSHGLVQAEEAKGGFEDPVEMLKQTELELEIRQKAASQLIQEDQVGSAKILFEACQSDPALLSEEVISYFGEKKYLPAVPMLQKALEDSEEPDFIYSSFFALAQMETDQADEYILNTCIISIKTKPSYYSYQCLLALHDTENKPLKKKAKPIFKGLARDPKTKNNPKLQKLVTDFINASQKRVPSSTASSSPAPSYTAPATPPAASVSPSIAPVIPRAQTSKRRPQTRPSSASKGRGIRSALIQRLGSRKASVLLERIDRYLKRHAENKGDVTNFLVRSYQRHYRRKRLDSQEARRLMQKGSAYPGSLRAVVKNIKREYRKAPLRDYSLSKIFRIRRSQAKLLLSL